MNTDYFKYIWEVYQTKSINRAAENLYLSQPYLSKCIKEVERQIGVQLIERSHKGVAFTESGEQFMIQAKVILAAMAEIDALASTQVIQPKTFVVSCFNSFTLINLIHLFSQEKVQTGLNVGYLEIQNHQILSHLANGLSNAGIFYFDSTEATDMYEQIEASGLVFYPIFEDALYAVIGRLHPLFTAASVRMETLSPYPLMLQKIKSDLASQERTNRGIYQLFKDFQVDVLSLDHNASLLFHISKDSHHFTLGQKAFNVDNPLVQHGDIRYLPIEKTDFSMITGLLVKQEHAQDAEVKELVALLKKCLPVSA